MSFPVVIEGTGKILGTIRLLGFGDETQRALSDATFDSEALALDRREVEYFAFVLRQLRELVGTGFLRKGNTLKVAVTDGGYLAYADARYERIAVPHQILREGGIPISEEARRLVLEDAMINAIYTLLGTKYCSGLQRYIDRFANPLWPLWYARQQIITVLAGLHRYVHLDLEQQFLLRDAYERIEVGDGDTQPYSQMLRELQGKSLPELPRNFLGRAISLVTLTPDLFPHFTDTQLLSAIKQQFVGEEGSLTASEDEIYEWMLENHRSARDVSEVLWAEHIATALGIEKSLTGINLTHNRPTDVLRKVAAEAPLHALQPLFLVGESAQILDDFCTPLEELCRELQANLQFGIDNVRTYVRLVLNFIAEHHGIGRYPGDRVEFLEGFADRLQKAQCHAGEFAARGYADAIDEDMRFRARRRASEDRAEALARERSEQARSRFMERLSTAGSNLPELQTVMRESLAFEDDLLVEDARGATNDMLRHFFGSEETSQQLMGLLERLIHEPRSSQSFKDAMQKRYSLSHDREIGYEKLSATQLFEIYVSLLIFEDAVPELEDAEGKLEVRRQVSAALNKERGILKGQLFSKKTGWVEDITTGELAASISKQIDDMRVRVEGGRSKFAPELVDMQFRLGLFAAVRDDHDDALTHFREVIRFTLDEELVQHMDEGRLTKRIDPGVFRKANKYFRGKEEQIRRAKAAGYYLELYANRAERALEAGRRPEIEPDQLDKIQDTLETERVLGDRAPNYKMLRYLPRIVSVGRHEYRVRDFLHAGAGGQAGQMALLRHVFADEPFADFMGYKIIETETEDGKAVDRFITKVGINNYVRKEYLKVFPRLFPNFEAEMVRQRNGLPNQIFTRKLIDELIAWLAKKSKDDVQHLRKFEVRTVELVEKAKRFPLLLLEFVPGLSDGLPKTTFSYQADVNGLLSRKASAQVAVEVETRKVKREIAARVMREVGITVQRQHDDMLDSLMARMRAHSAALAALLMNVDHQIFTVEGRLVAMDYEILFAPCFDPAWEGVEEPHEPVSTYFTKRLNVSWVSDRDDMRPYYEVGELYRSFILDRADQIMDWAMEAGFLLSEAGAVKDLLLRNANRLPEDLQTLVRCGGTAYLSGNRRNSDGEVEYGSLIPLNEQRARARAGLQAIVSGERGEDDEATVTTRKSTMRISQMTSRLNAIHEVLRLEDTRRGLAMDGDKAVNLAPRTGTARMMLDAARRKELGRAPAPGDEDEMTMDLSAQDADDEKTMDSQVPVRPRPEEGEGEEAPAP